MRQKKTTKSRYERLGGVVVGANRGDRGGEFK